MGKEMEIYNQREIKRKYIPIRKYFKFSDYPVLSRIVFPKKFTGSKQWSEN